MEKFQKRLNILLELAYVTAHDIWFTVHHSESVTIRYMLMTFWRSFFADFAHGKTLELKY